MRTAATLRTYEITAFDVNRRPQDYPVRIKAFSAEDALTLFRVNHQERMSPNAKVHRIECIEED